MKKLTALQLADALEVEAINGDMGRKPDPRCRKRQAAAELRRLHEANQEMLEALKELKLAVNSAITCGDWVVDGACDPDACLRRVEAAIAKGEQP